MKARCVGRVAAGRCTRPARHEGACRHIAARNVVPAMPAPRPLPPVVRGPQLVLNVAPKRAGKSARIRAAVAALPAMAAQASKVERKMLRETLDPKGTYRMQMINCRKSRCMQCNPPGEKSRASHGPYWYLEVNDGPRKRTRYVGKRLPAAILEHVAVNGHPAAAAAAQAQLAAAAERGA